MVFRRYGGGLFGTFWGTWTDFWQDTSISGLNNAGKAHFRPYVRRTIWLIIFTFFFGQTMYNVIDLINDYYEYPVTHSVYVKHEYKVNLTFNKLNYSVVQKDRDSILEL